MGSPPPQGPPPPGWGPPPQGPPPGWGPPPQGPPPGWGPPPQGPPPGWGPPPQWDPGKPPGGGSGKVIAIVVGVVVALVAVVVVLGVVVLRDTRSDDTTSAAASSSTSPSSTTSPSASGSSTAGSAPVDTCPVARPGPSTPAGWKTVAGKRGLSYDVPPTWTVESCGTLVGWEKKCDDGPFGYCPIRTMSGASSLESPRCPKSSLAVAGLPGAADTTDIATAVRDEAALVRDIYTSDSGVVPTVRLTAPRQFTVDGRPAVQIVASVSGVEPSACQGTTALHSMVATTVPGRPGSVLFVISLNQGVPGATAPADGDRMVASLRRAG